MSPGCYLSISPLHTLEKDRGISFSTPALTASHGEKTILFAKVRHSEDEIMWVDLWPIEAQ